MTLERELELIKKLNLARYFLTIKDIVDYARSVEPLFSVRASGSAAIAQCVIAWRLPA